MIRINHRQTAIRCTMLMSSILFMSCMASAQPCSPIEVAKLLGSNGAANDTFGSAVDIDGKKAVVGAPYHEDRGAAYVFHNVGGDEWVEVAKLTASDGAAGDRFGFDVAVAEGLVLIGAPFDDDHGTDSGSAYVFRHEGNGEYTEAAKLAGSDTAAGDGFGWAVAAGYHWLFVGAPYYDSPYFGADCGTVYTFVEDGRGYFEWRIPGGEVEGAQLGWAVESSGFGYTFIAGAPGAGGGTGSFAIYDWCACGEWQGGIVPAPPDVEEGDRLGHAVDLGSAPPYGKFAVVGAPMHDANGTNAGAAYVYEIGSWGRWHYEGKWLASDGAADDHFGSAVAAENDIAYVAAPLRDTTAGQDSGLVYQFVRGGQWREGAHIAGSDSEAGDQFGSALAAVRGKLIAGAPLHDDNGDDSGSAGILVHDCVLFLDVIGTCPHLAIEVVDATPNARIAILYARGEGAVTVPPGSLCAGTTLALDRTVQIGRIIRADEYGFARLEATVPSRSCGRVFLQAVDLESCATSNIERIN